MPGDVQRNDPNPPTGPACPTCRGRGWVRTLPPLWACVLVMLAGGILLTLIFSSGEPLRFLIWWPGIVILLGYLGSLYGIYANLTGTPSKICPRCQGCGQGR